MRRLHRLLGLSLRDKMLLIEAVLVLLGACAALRFVPFRTAMRFIPRRGAAAAPPELQYRVAWVMERAAKLLQPGSCLRQAIAAHYMLARRGYASSIEIGVALTEEHRMDAHAWLVSGDQVITGGTRSALARYTRLDGFGRNQP